MLIALVAGLSFVVIGAIVGVRMLLLARRTGGRPELLLGGGLCSLLFVTAPCVTLGLGLKVGPPVLQQAMFAIGLLPPIGLVLALYAFTALVFRPESRIAWSVVALGGGSAALTIFHTISARIAAWDADRVVSASWTIGLILVFVGAFLWGGVESLRYWRTLRRRLPLGLADPVVCNRFLLWGFADIAASIGLCVVIASLSFGWRLVAHPVPILGISFAGFSLSVCWWLAFLPPRFYLDRVSGSADAHRLP